ncbi:MAG TPA: response regulator transcription factor [Deinococcales bacterium]|nr:response regulator transcription factor [Deinococcales bacterium]
MSGEKHEILIVEDHAFTRDGLRAAINLDPELHVALEARSGEEALELLEGRSVAVAVLDIGLPGMDGIELARRVKAQDPRVRVLMLTAHTLRQEVLAALASGADGYALKSADPALLPIAVKAVAAGSAYLDPEIAGLVLGLVRAPDETPTPLTERETEVLRLVADGRGNKAIAAELGVSVSTVKLHVQEILEKLGASDRTHAAVKALRQGLL